MDIDRPGLCAGKVHTRTAKPTGDALHSRLRLCGLSPASVTQQFTVSLQSLNVVAYGLDTRRHRDGKYQPDPAPKQAEKHECHRDCERVQVNARAHQLRVHQVQGQQVKESDDGSDDQVMPQAVMNRQGDEERWDHRERHPNVRDQAQESAERPNQRKVGQLDRPEKDRAKYGNRIPRTKLPST